jgi:hypothetical protein
MKIKKTKCYNSKLFHLNLIESQIFNQKKNILKNTSKDFEYRFKKVISVLYKYQLHKKKILFLGFPKLFICKIKLFFENNDKHTFFSETSWVNGIFSNQKSIVKYLSNNKNWNNDLNFKMRYDLVVICNYNDLKENIIRELNQKRVPIVILTSLSSEKVTYNIFNNFKMSKSFLKFDIFFSSLLSIFKKANSLRA